jgi:Omp85 superfamily domain
MTRTMVVLCAALCLPAHVFAQPPADQPEGFADKLKSFGNTVFDLFGKPVRPTLEPIAPTGGVTGGAAVSPAPWRTESLIETFRMRASASTNKYWAVDGSYAWQHLNSWRVEPYFRARSMKRLSFYGLGNESSLADETDYALLERRMGAYGWKRPVLWLALGARGEALWPRTDSGASPSAPSIEQKFPPSSIPGFNVATDFLHAEAFVNINYPVGRNERPRRGGDYRLALGAYHDTSGTNYSFRRVDVEGQERFPVFGRDRQLTLHALVSMSFVGSDDQVPFYLMETIGGADNLRGFSEDIIGSDQTTSTLRAVDSFRFRDSNLVLLQGEFRHRLSSQVFVGVFVDSAMVAPTAGALNLSDLHTGYGVSVSIIRASVMAIRFDFGFGAGEGSHTFLTPGRAFGF